VNGVKDQSEREAKWSCALSRSSPIKKYFERLFPEKFSIKTDSTLRGMHGIPDLIKSSKTM